MKCNVDLSPLSNSDMKTYVGDFSSNILEKPTGVHKVGGKLGEYV